MPNVLTFYIQYQYVGIVGSAESIDCIQSMKHEIFLFKKKLSIIQMSYSKNLANERVS